jgi:hypothetical protein
MSDDYEYVANYIPERLYINPGSTGAFASIAGESEAIIGKVDVTSRCKLAVSAFFVKDKADFGSFKITKMRWRQKNGWTPDGHVQVNNFQLGQISHFLSIISHLDLSEAKKAKISLEQVDIAALVTLLGTDRGAAIVKELAESPELHQDIYALASKRAALADFERKLGTDASEREWQDYFEANPWVFGHGLNYVFLDKVGLKLESVTTGSAFDRGGKRIDALMRTRAEISQYVLIEIKRDATDLLRKDEYRSGCWAVSNELSGAVTQTQKTVFEFARDRFHNLLKDQEGNRTGEEAYAVEPRSFVVVGNLSQLQGNNDKIACFELYRRKLASPEIVTFDELFHRARCIVENLSSKVVQPTQAHPKSAPEASDADLDDDVPF